MALVVNDILQITDVQLFQSQQMLNVYFYRLESQEVAVDYADILVAWSSAVRTPVIAIQNVNCAHINTIIKNLTNGLDIAEFPDEDYGTVTGDPLQSFTAASFRLVRTTAETRHGAKRIGGLSEGSFVGNAPVAGFVTLAANVATGMGGTAERTGTVDHDLVMQPVIVGRIPIGSPGAGELDLNVINDVSSAQFIRVSTQTTRRAGRGN